MMQDRNIFTKIRRFVFIRCQMPDARCQMPDARCQMPAHYPRLITHHSWFDLLFTSLGYSSPTATHYSWFDLHFTSLCYSSPTATHYSPFLCLYLLYSDTFLLYSNTAFFACLSRMNAKGMVATKEMPAT